MERQGKTHNENARVLNEKEGEAIKRKDLLKEEDNAARKKKRLGTTGKDPQRKRTSLNEKEGEAIKRKDLLKEEDNAATKKRELREATPRTFHFGRASLKRNLLNIEMRTVQYFTLPRLCPRRML